MKPVVGITRCSRVDDYVESVKRAGGEPVVLDPADDPERSLDRVNSALQIAGNVLDNDNRIVDYESCGDRKGHERKIVNAVAQQVHDAKRTNE